MPALCTILALSGALLTGCSDDSSADRSGATGTPAPTDSVPVLQPGRPGEPNKTLTGPALSPSSTPATQADVTFMSDMIHHHAQAVVMVNMVDGKLTDPEVKRMASRIKAEQTPEITYMKKWLKDNAGSKSSGHDHGGTHSATGKTDHSDMPGMASAAELKKLSKAKGKQKDITFLGLMITHHGGALTMIDDRYKAGGTDIETGRLANDIGAGQTAQIKSMAAMRKRLGGAPVSTP